MRWFLAVGNVVGRDNKQWIIDVKQKRNDRTILNLFST